MALYRYACIITLLAITATAAVAQNSSDPWTVDFRYKPYHWQTAICLPDDWQKTLVDMNGSLLYDYPGGIDGFGLKLSASVGDPFELVSQELLSPRVPIVRTVKRMGAIEITEDSFAVAPLLKPIATKDKPKLRVVRTDSFAVSMNWAKPTGKCDPAYGSIAVGWGNAIRYSILDAGSKEYTIVFGLCEGYHESADRILDLSIEGKKVKTVDLISEFGRNTPTAIPIRAKDLNGDGKIDISVATTPDSKDKNAILNVLWVFDSATIPPIEQIMAGQATGYLARIACGAQTQAGGPRNDVMIFRVRNTGDTPANVNPHVGVFTQPTSDIDYPDSRYMTITANTRLTATEDFTPANDKSGVITLAFKMVALAPGEERTYAIGVSRGDGAQQVPTTVAQANELRDRAIKYWQKADLPYNHIEIPDPGIQAQLDSSIRNIYQARELKGKDYSFNVGPTCYRGLWVVDGSFILDSITMLDRWQETRRGIEYLYSFQKADGAVELIGGHRKETGIALWILWRHAQQTGDKKWLTAMWPHMQSGFEFIRAMRKESMAEPDSLSAGLIPAGFSDGGLGGIFPEYTNVYWTMVGLHAAVEAAKWLGKTDQAADWQREYDDFYATFRRAAKRDMKTDANGNRYLPIRMGDSAGIAPQRAQWAFCHAVFPGELFPKDDPLVVGNLAMLATCEKEGLIAGTGWLDDGIWNYFAGFYAHAALWRGDGEKSGRILYAFANHASPLLAWREEQNQQGQVESICGDMPHNWGSAEYIRLVYHMLILERGDELHLFEGMPAKWTQPGNVTKVKDVLTNFGPMSFEFRVSKDGKMGTLKLTPPKRSTPSKIVLHLDRWSGKTGAVELPTTGPITKEIVLVR